MNVEIVFTGLCSFLNLRDVNKTMPEPSVILVETRGDASHAAHGAGAAAQGADEHIAFIGFDSRVVKVADETGFQPVPQDVQFKYLPLSGVELTIANDPPGSPTVDKSYDKVVRKDDYWPEVKDKWNRAYVPARGQKPKKSAVVAFMRFGKGKITASRMSLFQWQFAKLDGSLYSGNFAEEVVYSGFPHSGNEVVITLLDLDTHASVRVLRFSALTANPPATLTIAIGNNVMADMPTALKRKAFDVVNSGHHFAFLNKIADTRSVGPIPTPIAPSKTGAQGHPGGGGGGVGGICGPSNGNS